jgi:tRNA threonylcarbamoyladenosine biosynthesis protein TsaB
MGEIYCAAYERVGGEWREAVAPALCAPREAPFVSGEGWIAVGSAFKAHGAVLARRYGTHLRAIHADRFPTASSVARLGARMFAHGHATDAAQAVPIYLRDKVALTEQERGAKR